MSKAQSLAESIVHRYLALMRYQRHSNAVLRKTSEISGRQLAVVRFLVENGTSTVSQISQFLYVSDATASLMLERMEQGGLIERHRCDVDSRRVLVEPTALGRRLAATAPPTAIALMRSRLPLLDLETLEKIDQALEVLAQVSEVDEAFLD